MTQAQPENPEFDVFLAHNSEDKPEVRVIANQLKQRGIKIWLDEEQIPPGRSIQDEIQKAIRLVKSAAIFIGLKGFGKWQTMELRPLTTKCVERNIPLIPVLLPGVSQFPEELVFLKEYRWVNFSKNIDDVEALNDLVWGITQKLSSPQNMAQNMNQLLTEIVAQTNGALHSIILFDFNTGLPRSFSDTPRLSYNLFEESSIGEALKDFDNIRRVQKALNSFGEATSYGQLDYSIFKLDRAILMIYFARFLDNDIAVIFIVLSDKVLLGNLIRIGKTNIRKIIYHWSIW